MGKKTKSKQRLDKFYHYAKEQGYRSRAAFKLIQLNRKYNFLNDANISIDLCAAPGGWLQVADQFMPMSSVKIGIDLAPIKHIPHCKTILEDITAPNCLALIKKEIKHNKADVVLHDGAPNVGANWQKDAYTQSELVLHSLKLATQVLRKGGTFVTKVFRSTDYNSLIWVFSKFFEKVEATKPEASRTTSAEIFVVCLRYLDPEYIDPKLFDSREVFKDTEADSTHKNYATSEINSLTKLMQQRRWRQGYDDTTTGNLHKKVSIEEFFKMENPFPCFAIYNEFTYDEKFKEEVEKYGKVPDDWEEMFKDLKVLGKREIAGLIKWKRKINLERRKQKMNEKQTIPNTEKIENEPEVNSDQELERQIQENQHEEISKTRKERGKKDKKILKYARAFGENTGLTPDDEEELFDIFKHKKISKVGYLDVDENDDYQVENSSNLKGSNRKLADHKEMEKNLEKIYERKLDQASKKIRKTKNSTSVAFPNIECQQIPQTTEPVDSSQVKSKLSKKWFQNPIFADLQKDADLNQIFENPLKNSNQTPLIEKNEAKGKKKKVFDEENDEESDSGDKYELKVPLSEMEKRRRRLKRQREKIETKKKKTIDPEADHEIEIVAQESKFNFEDFDIDELAETRALAKKMLRKKDRESIIDSTYSKYAFDDDVALLPNWFKEDEERHNHAILPITKEEFAAEKERLMAINARAPKKVIEAKIRNQKRMAKKMKRAKKSAEVIIEQEGVTEGSKARQIQNLYKKQLASVKREKKYIVGRKLTAGPGGRDSRSVKHVDRRLKKDRRGEKKAGKNIGMNKKIKKTSHKKFNRRKRK